MLESRGIALVAAAVLILSVSACSSDAASTLTLTETKSPTQLLRLEASSRIPSGSIKEIVEEQDTSVACKTAEEDPKELYRSWKSSLRATIDADAAWRVTQISTDVADSFIEDGWYVSGTKDGKNTTTVTRPGAVSKLAFTATAGDETGAGASVQIDATGPCVLTAGPDSSEVTKLEAAK